jgi:hypothetical protein
MCILGDYLKGGKAEDPPGNLVTGSKVIREDKDDN